MPINFYIYQLKITNIPGSVPEPIVAIAAYIAVLAAPFREVTLAVVIFAVAKIVVPDTFRLAVVVLADTVRLLDNVGLVPNTILPVPTTALANVTVP